MVPSWCRVSIESTPQRFQNYNIFLSVRNVCLRWPVWDVTRQGGKRNQNVLPSETLCSVCFSFCNLYKLIFLDLKVWRNLCSAGRVHAGHWHGPWLCIRCISFKISKLEFIQILSELLPKWPKKDLIVNNWITWFKWHCSIVFIFPSASLGDKQLFSFFYLIKEIVAHVPAI